MVELNQSAVKKGPLFDALAMQNQRPVSISGIKTPIGQQGRNKMTDSFDARQVTRFTSLDSGADSTQGMHRMNQTQPAFARHLKSESKQGGGSRSAFKSIEWSRENDGTLRKTGLSVGLVAGTEKNQPFGHQFYRSPAADTRYRIRTGNVTNKEKLKSFCEQQQKLMAFAPGPKYVQHDDWRNNIKGRRGKFLKGQRKTFTDEVMEFEKVKPAPSKYDNKEKLKKAQKIEGSYLYKDNRVHFTEHKKWLAVQVPPAKYNNQNVALTKPRSVSTKIYSPEEKGWSSWQIPKMDGPGPGSYAVPEAIQKSQWAKVKGYSKQTNFPPSFTDRHKKMLSHVPGSGHYKKMETAKDQVAKDVNFKYKRH